MSLAHIRDSILDNEALRLVRQFWSYARPRESLEIRRRTMAYAWVKPAIAVLTSSRNGKRSHSLSTGSIARSDTELPAIARLLAVV